MRAKIKGKQTIINLPSKKEAMRETRKRLIIANKIKNKLAAYRLQLTNPNYSHASSLFLSGGGFFLVKPTFSIIEPHFGHLILLF